MTGGTGAGIQARLDPVGDTEARPVGILGEGSPIIVALEAGRGLVAVGAVGVRCPRLGGVQVAPIAGVGGGEQILQVRVTTGTGG